ncbi:MAG: uroporphyrinogen-III C-methyltransferase [Gammaproteobacteria bacterium]
MTDPATPAPSRNRVAGPSFAIVLVLLALVAWAGWRHWQARQAGDTAQLDQAQRLQALELRLDALRRDQRAQAQRLQQAEATNRLLREELLGIGQRAALLEDTLSRLSDPDRQGAQSLRLDEAEFLLSAAAQRLELAGDLDGARRAYELAAGALDGIDDPAWLSLRQTLAQERAALADLDEHPRAVAAGRLDAFEAALSGLPERAAARPDAPAPAWWRRLLTRLVQARPSSGEAMAATGDRAPALAALRLELALARAALERGDRAGFAAALQRARAWVLRLWPDSPQRAAALQALQQLQALPLRPELPVLGSTLEQLRRLRAS